MDLEREYLHLTGLGKEGFQIVLSGAVGQVSNVQLASNIFIINGGSRFRSGH